MNIDSNTRLIDLKVSDLLIIFKELLSDINQAPSVSPDNDEIGGYEIAEKITGYSRQTLYQLKSAGEIPYIALPSGGVRFSKKMIVDWLISNQSLTNKQIAEKAENMVSRRKLRRK